MTAPNMHKKRYTAMCGECQKNRTHNHGVCMTCGEDNKEYHASMRMNRVLVDLLWDGTGVEPSIGLKRTLMLHYISGKYDR